MDAELIPTDDKRPLVVVSVGTDHHRFDRLIQWTEDFAGTRPDIAFVVQRGTSRRPNGVVSQELIPHAEIQAMFAKAIVVVSHGGPSTVMDARAQGRMPIVVPRNPEFGEHVDGHQMRFAVHLGANGIAKVAQTELDFNRLLSQAIADPMSMTLNVGDVSVPPGVIKLGQVLDDLLGVKTPINAGLSAQESQPRSHSSQARSEQASTLSANEETADR